MTNEPTAAGAHEDASSPLTGSAMEAARRNVYHAHPLMVDSGTFWRCIHGNTGLAAGLEWVGCAECAAADPEAYNRFHAAAPSPSDQALGSMGAQKTQPKEQ